MTCAALFTPAGVSREDRTRVPNMLVYNRVLTILGMVPQFVLVDEARASNAPLHVYNHDCAELRSQRQF